MREQTLFPVDGERATVASGTGLRREQGLPDATSPFFNFYVGGLQDSSHPRKYKTGSLLTSELGKDTSCPLSSS